MQDTMTLDDIRDAFRFFDSWEDKYRFVIDLGKSLPALPDDRDSARQ
jgi:cysteine desulfuration protein SufE